MRKYSHQTNQILKQTQSRFQEYIEPTILSENEFNRIFKFKKSVGEGSYGAIKCVQNYDQKIFAIKQSKDRQNKYGLYRQVAIMKKFFHPNILKAIGFYQIQESRKLIILTEFCKYKSLANFSPNLKAMSLEQKYRLCAQVSNGIYALHNKNIMHRDLKPDNILIDQNKTAKICDFGFCQFDFQDQLIKTAKVGTPLYNSPETDKGTYTKKCDIFSYGLIVYFILTNGKHLFKTSATHEELKQSKKTHFKKGSKAFAQIQVPDKIKQLLENTIAQKQEKRYNIDQVKQFWQRFTSENSLNGLKFFCQGGEDRLKKYSSRQIPDQSKQSKLQTWNLEQKITIQIIKIKFLKQEYFQITQDIIFTWRQLKILSQTFSCFKSEIQMLEINVAFKNLLSFICLFILELHLQNFLILTIRLLDRTQKNNFLQLSQKIHLLLDKIIHTRKFLALNLIKFVKFIKTNKSLFRPANLFQPKILMYINEVTKLQLFLKELFGQQKTIQSFQVKNEIPSNKELFSVIQQKFRIEISLIEFKIQTEVLLTKFRREKTNAFCQRDSQKADQIVQNFKALNFLNFVT